MQSRVAALLAGFGGLTITLAVFAQAFGLDNDPGWGIGRAAILIFGCLTILCSLLYSRYEDRILGALSKSKSYLLQSLSRPLTVLRNYWHSFFAFIVVLLVYIWFASSGSWVRWHSPTRYYSNLAQSFKQGVLSLPGRPSPELLNLPNPYDPLSRKGIEYPIDYSLYNGKYYLYWGPVPAVLLVALDPFVHKKVGDLYLAFGFICGLFVLQSLLSVIVWNRFFRGLPTWMLSFSLLLLGLGIPWTYMLINEPSGRIYEAAISGAQFFLLGGLVVAVLACLKATPPGWLLTIAGLLWTLAIGTRLVLVLPIGFMGLMVIQRAWKTTSPSRMNFWMKLISLGWPLALGLICLGWYNWARFGSVTETGFTYGLATMNMQEYQGELFSPVYIVQNLYNYLLNPPGVSTQFPYLHPQEGMEQSILPFFSLPRIYKTNAMTGLLFVAPFSVFALLSVVILKKSTQGDESQFTERQERNLWNWIVITLLGAYFSAFCFLLIFFWAAMRYMGDFMPSLAMASGFGFWQGYRLVDEKPASRMIYSTLGILLILASILVNILVSVSVQRHGLHGF